MPAYRPQRRTNGLPANRAAQYMKVAPSQEPSAPAITMPSTLRAAWLVCAKWAAGGIMTSLGSGTKELSTAISSTMRGYPPVMSVARYQPIKPLNMEGFVILQNPQRANEFQVRSAPFGSR